MQRWLVGTALVCSTMMSKAVAAFAPQPFQTPTHSRLAPPARDMLRASQFFYPSKTRIPLDEAPDDAAITFLGHTDLPSLTSSFLPVWDDSQRVNDYFQQITGGNPLELTSVTDDNHGNSRFAFIQTLLGIPILGTYALAQIVDDKVRYSRYFLINPPHVSTEADIAPTVANRLALAHMQALGSPVNLTDTLDKLMIIHQHNKPYLAWVVVVATPQPGGQFDVFVDAHAGVVLDFVKTTLDAVQGSVIGMVENGCPGAALQTVTLPYVEWSKGMVTNGEGDFQSDSITAQQAQVQLSGPYFRINNYQGSNTTWNVPLMNMPVFNQVSLEQAPLSEIDPFYYASQVRQWFRSSLMTIDEGIRLRAWNWTDQQLPINVNLPSGFHYGSCNAFYDGKSLNFYVANSRLGCNNTGRVAKIVYHEYAHGVHEHLTAGHNTFNQQVSEGVADYVAATMTNDPQITGLLGCNQVLPGRTTLRTCENRYTYCKAGSGCHSSPRDEPHNAAPVLCGALWELRNQFKARYGDTLGAIYADRFLMRFLTLVTDMNSAYGAAIAADQDNDQDPSNGTQHSCEINRAFVDAGADGIAHFPDAAIHRVPCVNDVLSTEPGHASSMDAASAGQAVCSSDAQLVP